MVVANSSAQTWALFKEQVDDTIIKALQPKILYPLLAKVYPANGPIVEFNVTDSYLDAEEESEAGEYANAVLNYERKFASVKDIGLAPRIPVNWIKDSRWDLVNDHVEAIGFGIARSINKDMMDALNIFVSGGTYRGQSYSAVANHVVAATDVWSGVAASIVMDISNALEALESDDAGDGRKFLILNPKAFKYIRTDPNFFRYINSGENKLIRQGIYPTPYGVEILVSSQAPLTYGLMVNVDLASIKYYEREALTIEIEKSARSKQIDVVAYIRYALACARPKALVKLTGLTA